MASDAYFTWVSKGKPYTLTRPARELQALLRGYGYTVHDYPNDDHQTADPPEDHTPYSSTEWPVQVSAYIGHAVDIMPPEAAALAKGAIALPNLARRIIHDRDAKVLGTTWIKYMNWTDENGVCRKESWKTTPRTTTPSTDKGHIHLSGRTDTESMSIADWNPIMTDIPLTWQQDQAFRVAALIAGLDEISASAPTAGEDVLAWKRIAKELAPQFAAILAQAQTNGSLLSSVIQSLTEIKATIATGGVDPVVLEQMVRDAVRVELNATRFTNG